LSTKLIEDFDILTAVELKKLRTQLKKKSAHSALQLLKTQYPAHYQLIYSQIALEEKLLDKLPTFEKQGCWITHRAFEQASSEVAAQFKSGLINGKHLLDLSAGIGIDDLAFAKGFTHITSIDSDAELHLLALLNLKLLGVRNIKRLHTKAEAFLADTHTSYDWVYIDADRRPDGIRKYGLEDTTPNVLALLPAIWEISNSLMLKLSPLMDLSYLFESLKGIAHIYVVAIQNEVKEILVLVQKDFVNETIIHAVDLNKQGDVLHHSQYPRAEMIKPIITQQAELAGMYLYEPRVAFTKSGLWRNQFLENHIALISNQHNLGVAHTFEPNVSARAFHVVAQLPINPKRIKQYLKAQAIDQAHIACKNFKTTPDELRRLYKLKDGGDNYLFFTINSEQKGIFLHTRKCES
jgi:hypothetical protein